MLRRLGQRLIRALCPGGRPGDRHCGLCGKGRAGGTLGTIARDILTGLLLRSRLHGYRPRRKYPELKSRRAARRPAFPFMACTPELSLRGPEGRGNLVQAVTISPMAFLQSDKVLRDSHSLRSSQMTTFGVHRFADKPVSCTGAAPGEACRAPTTRHRCPACFSPSISGHNSPYRRVYMTIRHRGGDGGTWQRNQWTGRMSCGWRTGRG